MSKKQVIADRNDQLNECIRCLKKIYVGSPMDGQEFAKECLEKIGIDTSDTSNFNIF